MTRRDYHRSKDEVGTGKMDGDRSAGDVASAISEAATRLAHIAMGRGSPEATTTFGNDWVTVVVLGIDGEVQDALFAPSREQLVRVRGEIHRAMREELVAKIERQLDRRVLAFIDQSSTDRDTVGYMYLLVPAPSAA